MNMGAGGLGLRGHPQPDAPLDQFGHIQRRFDPLQLRGAQTVYLDLSSYSGRHDRVHFQRGQPLERRRRKRRDDLPSPWPINGQTYTLLYPYNTVTRRNVQVRTDGLRFYGGYERWQDYNLGIINSFELDVPWDAGWTLDNNCCVPCYIYGFM